MGRAQRGKPAREKGPQPAPWWAQEGSRLCHPGSTRRYISAQANPAWAEKASYTRRRGRRAGRQAASHMPWAAEWPPCRSPAPARRPRERRRPAALESLARKAAGGRTGSRCTASTCPCPMAPPQGRGARLGTAETPQPLRPRAAPIPPALRSGPGPATHQDPVTTRRRAPRSPRPAAASPSRAGSAARTLAGRRQGGRRRRGAASAPPQPGAAARPPEARG